MNSYVATAGTCWRMGLSQWYEYPRCDVFLLVLGPGEAPGEANCLLLGIDCAEFEAKPGHRVPARYSDLKPMFP